MGNLEEKSSLHIITINQYGYKSLWNALEMTVEQRESIKEFSLKQLISIMLKTLFHICLR